MKIQDFICQDCGFYYADYVSSVNVCAKCGSTKVRVKVGLMESLTAEGRLGDSENNYSKNKVNGYKSSSLGFLKGED